MQVDMDFVGPGELEGDVVGAKPDAGSLLANLQARREALAGDEVLDLPIPTWNGDLIARYRVIERREVERLAGKVKNGKAANANADVDLLVRACAGVFLRGEAGDLVALADDAGPVRFDSRLAALLRIEADTARDVVQYLFRANTIAISAHCARVVEWMQDTSADVDGALLGEP